MMQIYSMILWSVPQNQSIQEMIDIIFNIMMKLKEYGDELDPKYLTAKRKKDAKPFDCTKSNLMSLINHSINKSDNIEFPELPRNFSFFSSLNSKESSSIGFSLGGSNSKFKNALVVNLPYDFSGLTSRRDDFYYIFKQLIETFQPYYGFVSNSLNNQLSDTFWDMKPSYVHWINYYSNNIISKTAKSKILSLDGVEIMPHGVILKLFNEPLDVNNKTQLKRQLEVSKLLEFKA